MAKFLIEIPHKDEDKACVQLLESFMNTGSHLLTNAQWGCTDGEHKAWIILNADDREQARMFVPPNFRARARIVRLSRFSMNNLDELRKTHPG